MKNLAMIFNDKSLLIFIVIISITLFGSAVPVPPDKAKSLEAFNTVLKVLKSPRCMNCHPSDDRPRQGDDMHIHKQNIIRGLANQGGVVQKCQTCHHEENNSYTNVPGAPHWGLAPKSMGWMSLTNAELGQALLDKEKNGNRSAADIAHHMTNDALVLWAWNPGEGRTPPPVALKEFKAAVAIWLKNGAAVPE